MQANKLLLAWCFLACIAGTACKSQKPVSNSRRDKESNTVNASETAPNTTGTTHFGALITTPGLGWQQANNFRQRVAQQLNIRYLRDNINLDTPKAHTLLETDFDVVLNINSTAPRAGKHYPFPTDTVAYKRQLSAVLSSLPKKPVLIAIENEANNNGYYSGSAKDYINLLKAATGVAHSYHIPLTDAGTTGAAIKYLLYQYYLQNGMQQQVKALKERQKMGQGPNIIASAAFADSVINALRTMPVDYVNMHWYQNTTDTQDLEAAVNYLKQRTGKEVISNEIGQSIKPDPDVVVAIIKKCKQLQLPYVIWYSGNSITGARAKALHTSAGTLDRNGQAFKNSL